MRFFLFFLISFLSQTIFAATTIATLNIANYNDHGNWAERRELITDVLRKTNADVILLQEVRFDPNEPSTKQTYLNSAEQILNLLKQQANTPYQNATILSQPAMYYAQGKIWEGLSIISKRKILETGSILLSQTKNCRDTNKRITQYIKIETDNQPLYLFNVHFAFEPTCAEDNARETVAYIKRVAQNNPVVMLGDFNLRQDDPAFRHFDAVHLIDVWRYLRPSEQGYTFPAERPAIRFDYVWVTPSIAASLHNQDQLSIFANTQTNHVYPSDHYGLVLRLV